VKKVQEKNVTFLLNKEQFFGRVQSHGIKTILQVDRRIFIEIEEFQEQRIKNLFAAKIWLLIQVYGEQVKDINHQ